MFDNFNVNLRINQRILNLYSMYSYSGIRSIERTLSWLERRIGIARLRVRTPLKSRIFQASLRNC